MDLKSKIRLWCTATGKKPYKLTELSGVHHSIVYRYLKGKDMLLGNAKLIEAAIDKDLGG
ncbi:MAG: hypothetical protein ACYSR0_09560 [Planctomycetota bacterium]